MRQFLHYWFVAVPKLTKAQACCVLYRFVRYVSWSYDVEWGEYDSDAEDRPWVDLEDWDEEMVQQPPKWYDFPPASHCSVGVKNCKDPDCPVKKQLARMDAARKKDQGEDNG
jgi:hypothetical protein